MEKIYFEGVVVNQDQLPLSEVTVVILRGPAEHPDIAAITNEKGEFSFSELIPGTYLIKFMNETIEAEKWIEVKEHMDKVRIVLE